MKENESKKVRVFSKICSLVLWVMLGCAVGVSFTWGWVYGILAFSIFFVVSYFILKFFGSYANRAEVERRLSDVKGKIKSGLVWDKERGPETWASVQDIIREIHRGGDKSWRLPSVSEMRRYVAQNMEKLGRGQYWTSVDSGGGDCVGWAISIKSGYCNETTKSAKLKYFLVREIGS